MESPCRRKRLTHCTEIFRLSGDGGHCNSDIGLVARSLEGDVVVDCFGFIPPIDNVRADAELFAKISLLARKITEGFDTVSLLVRRGVMASQEPPVERFEHYERKPELRCCGPYE